MSVSELKLKFSKFLYFDTEKINFFFLLKQQYSMKAVKCPTDELTLTNKAIVNPNIFPDDVK